MIEYYITPFEFLDRATLYDIMALREQVFTFEQKCTDIDLDALDKQAIHVYGIIDEEIIATARILPPGVYKSGIVSFGRLAVANDYRGKGYGKDIMLQVLHYIESNYPNIPVEFSAQKYLQNFYEDLNFQASGQPYDEGDIPHIKMLTRNN